MAGIGETRLHCPLMGLPVIQKWDGSSWVDNPIHENAWVSAVDNSFMFGQHVARLAATVNDNSPGDDTLHTGMLLDAGDGPHKWVPLSDAEFMDASRFFEAAKSYAATVTTEPRHEPDLIQNDPTHRAVRDVVKGLDNGVVLPAARKQLGEALDRANTRQEPLPEGTKHRAPDSRAFSFGV